MPSRPPPGQRARRSRRSGQRIAVADDAAFAFRYALVTDGWRAAGAEILPFSPLADEAPDAGADAVYLPGGYPELHAGRLAAAGNFLAGLRAAAARGAAVFGECGGYMVLGRGLVDADGHRHAMAGLLPLETSFADRGLHLGYRRADARGRDPARAGGQPLPRPRVPLRPDAERRPGHRLVAGVRRHRPRPRHRPGSSEGSVFGSFVHLIAGEAAP